MKPQVRHTAALVEAETQERCAIAELSNIADDPAVSIARARVAPGITTRWHRLHGIAERYAIIAGQGIVEIGDLPAQAVTAGDVVLIPPLCRQRIRNTGADDLLFLAICSPRFDWSAYEDLGD